MNRRGARLGALCLALGALGVLPFALPLLTATGPAGAVTTTTVATPSPTAASRALFAHLLNLVPPGFMLIEQGPLSAAQFASYSPNPPAAADALATLQQSRAFATGAKAWIDASSFNGIVDLVVALPTAADANAYRAGQIAPLDGALDTKKARVGGIPGGLHYSFLTPVPSNGVEQVVVFSVGRYAATVRFISLATKGNAAPFTAAQADSLSVDQYRLLAAAARADSPPPAGGSHVLGWVALGVAAGLVLIGLAGLVFRRKKPDRAGGTTRAEPPQAASPPPAEPTKAGGDIPPLPPAPLDPVLSLPMPAAGTPAGWLEDPAHDDGRVRYWNGAAWTKNWGEPA
jgi:hypothetical protein